MKIERQAERPEANPTETHVSEAARVAGIIAQTSADFTGQSESKIRTALVERFDDVGLEISLIEAQRIAHDIAFAPRNRGSFDD